ncbi:histidine kinase dimerization/phospho-acceptor domain-containing protein [Solilutibacter silvestris]|uniref:histidine kinase n=1 Tax=Solilutibacter silvestris TaxID=1645665 RepID=A0A2K1Q156_9GAMM|nr:HAMP domain-containing sensor histidine kinase [Lysobacter silvestris]PNS08773.1 His Kinase A (phospho-acceptor) domain [Lysobacter silvestris]
MGDDDKRDDDGTRTLRSGLARVVSHDLRAPLRAIKGFAKLLDAGGGLDDSGRDHLSRIRVAADQLDGMMVDLVDWLRTDAAEIKRAPVDLSLLADWAVMDLLDAHPGRDAQVDVQPEMQAIGDEHLLRQMLQRLLHVSWSRAGVDAPIRITVSASDDAGATLLRIHDSGHEAAEPASEFAALRDPRDHDIGMTIARRIAERHGGALESESNADGTTVRVRLPD